MSKGYAEALALIEAGKQMALANKADDKKPQRSDKKDKPPTWEQLWLEEQQRRAKFDDFMKVLKKQLAEDPKEKDKKKWDLNVDKVALLLFTILPINWAVMYLILK